MQVAVSLVPDIALMPVRAGEIDLVLTGARILTLDGRTQTAEAVAIAGDRIVAVGAAADIAALASRRTISMDLGGATVVPGFNDTHAHMEREGLKTLRPSLRDARSIADILHILRTAATNAASGTWIVTMPVGEPPFFFDGLARIAEGRLPDRHEIDAVVPDHPVCIPGLFGNWGRPPGYTALNSPALRLNGIDRDTRPLVPGIEICRDASGEPTGHFVEHNARPVIEFDLLKAVPRFALDDRIEGIRRSMRLYNAAGTTSVYEGHGSAPETIAAYRTLWERGELTVRVGLVVSPTWADAAEADRAMRDWLAHARGRGLGDPWLRLSGIHLALGGDPLVAELARADLPNTGWSGFVEQATTLGEFRDYCELAARHDLRVHTIVGDRLGDVLPILEEIDAGWGLRGRRWVIEHIADARPEDIRRLAGLGVEVTVIPVYYVWKQLDGSDRQVPLRDLLDAGVPTAAATDNIPYQPLFTLWVMAARRARDGRLVGADQRVSQEEALRLLTCAGARLTFEEHRKGIVAPGYFADLAVLDGDPTAVGLDEIRHIDCVATLVGGHFVHGGDRP